MSPKTKNSHKKSTKDETPSQHAYKKHSERTKKEKYSTTVN